jgi:flagellar FliJ protein
MTFRFRLQRVLELRAEAEQAKARALAEARSVADAARQHHDAIAELHQSSRAEVHAAHAQEPRVGHLRQLGLVLQSLEERLDSAAEVVQNADGVVAGAQSELEMAARDRRVLDRLKERHAETWRADEAHKDRLQMDEIALARFARIRDSKEDGSSSAANKGATADTAHQNGTEK